MKSLMLLAALALAACGNGRLRGGAVCHSNEECDVALSCLETLSDADGGACLPSGTKVCTKSCTAASECISGLTACVANCGGNKLCAGSN